MPLGFLKRGSIFGANALALIQMGAFVAMTFILTNYFQQILGYSALSTGIAFLPMSIVFLIISGFLSAQIGKPLWCQTYLNFRDGFADCRIPICFREYL